MEGSRHKIKKKNRLCNSHGLKRNAFHFSRILLTLLKLSHSTNPSQPCFTFEYRLLVDVKHKTIVHMF